ncbi:hypothetical protein [Nannocystis pusilla]|uniref:hypothetical protein n=1 Tax=Nannocystis pusilla TaxID=889268 RepID=UPI003B773557
MQTPQSGPARATSARATTPVVVQKPLPEPTWRSADNRARLYKGDSLEILERVPAESIDVIFADPRTSCRTAARPAARASGPASTRARGTSRTASRRTTPSIIGG